MSPAAKKDAHAPARPPAPAVSPKAPAARRAPHDDPDRAREKSAEREVAGRHKNDGQKDHKGAR